MPEWYVIQTKPKKENIAVIHLWQKEIRVFFPKIEVLSIVYGKYRKCLKPLFPNYLFVHFDPPEHYKTVRYTRGVNKVLGFNGKPTPIHKDVIKIIKARVDQNECVQKVLHFKANDNIRIRSGPFKDLMGIFDRWMPEEGRVRVLINLLNYPAKIDLHHSQLEKVA